MVGVGWVCVVPIIVPGYGMAVAQSQHARDKISEAVFQLRSLSYFFRSDQHGSMMSAVWSGSGNLTIYVYMYIYIYIYRERERERDKERETILYYYYTITILLLYYNMI